MSQAELNISLHEKQALAFNSLATEILYGGAAGGGKSHLMRVMAICACAEVAGLQVYLFRRVSTDLFKNHVVGSGGFFELMSEWLRAGLVRYNASENVFIFWNDSRIWLCHCQHEKDMLKYQGAEIHLLLIDELTHFTEQIYTFLRGRCRLGSLKIPENRKGLFPRILCGSNPGSIGHTWVRKTFVNNAPPLTIKQMEKKQGGMKRQYIPAVLQDNPTLLENDPDYKDRLSGLGNPALVRAMLEGDWNIVAGGALDDLWVEEILRLPRFPVPEEWRIDRSFDWGSRHPFSVGWWAEANGEEVKLPDGGTFCPPKGTLIRIAEWYGSKEVGSNQGLSLGSEEIALGIARREKELLEGGWIQGKVHHGPADNQIFNKTDSSVPTIADQMQKHGIRWATSDKSAGSRVAGLQLLRDRLKNSLRDEGAGIYFMENCLASFEILPVLPRDEKNPEDVDTNAEDHLYDEVRYRCLASKTRAAKGFDIKFGMR